MEIACYDLYVISACLSMASVTLQSHLFYLVSPRQAQQTNLGKVCALFLTYVAFSLD